MMLPPLFWPWEYFRTCMGNVPNFDLCLKWTIELYAWQVAVIAIVITVVVLVWKNRKSLTHQSRRSDVATR